MNWNEYFILGASWVKIKSKDQSTKIGCIVVDEAHSIRATGFNGFPRGIDDTNPQFHERPTKYQVTEHAERNAIFDAARAGVSLEGCTMYLAHDPVRGICTGCARGIIQSGIKKLVGPRNKYSGKKTMEMSHDLDLAYHLLQEAGVEFETDATINLPQHHKFVHTTFHKNLEELEKRRCPDCGGLGYCNDAEPGDIGYRSWKCSPCGGTGMT